MAKIEFENKQALNENANIPDINKVKDSDLNEIKNVVNQTILNSLFGVYYDSWQSSETYSIGDIVIYDAILYENLTGNNTATTPDQDSTNWQVINILLNTKVNPKLIDKTNFIKNTNNNSQTDTYSCNYINGITDKTPNYCVATTTDSTQTVSSYYIININKIEWGNGNFTLSNNGIKIGAGIHHVRISGAFFIDSWPSGYNYIWGQILLNGYKVSGSILSSGASYISIVIPTTIISVKENDIITFIADAPVGQGTIRNGVDNTWLCIEKID